MEPLTASDLARRLGVDVSNARRAIERARREGTHLVTRGTTTARGGRPPWVIWWPVAAAEEAA